MRNIQEKLIQSIFKGVLSENVLVLNLKDDEDLDFAILIRSNLPKSLFNVSVKEYSWDYGIFEEKGRWSYSIMVHYGGSYDEPPSSDSEDSSETYATFDSALHALVMAIVDDNYGKISEEVYYLTCDEFE